MRELAFVTKQVGSRREMLQI